ncbi:MAG: prolyl oligopeptidase family serine peptidase, partial [Planctomycetota bacterium]
MNGPVGLIRTMMYTTLCLLVVSGSHASAQKANAKEQEKRPAVARWPIGEQTQEVLSTSDGGQIEYLLSVPPAVDSNTSANPPLMLFLHGRGESNGPLPLVAKWGPPKIVAQGQAFPYLLVSPQCPREDFWSSPTQQKRLFELLDHIIKSHKLDQSRIYLTGLSMGGYGSWAMAAAQPKRFAAVVPICGGGDPERASELVDIPIWVFHGDQDGA